MPTNRGVIAITAKWGKSDHTRNHVFIAHSSRVIKKYALKLTRRACKKKTTAPPPMAALTDSQAEARFRRRFRFAHGELENASEGASNRLEPCTARSVSRLIRSASLFSRRVGLTHSSGASAFFETVLVGFGVEFGAFWAL